MQIIIVVSLGNNRFIGCTKEKTIYNLNDLLELKGKYLSPDLHSWACDAAIIRSDTIEKAGQLVFAGVKLWKWAPGNNCAFYELCQLWPLGLSFLALMGSSTARYQPDEEGKIYDCTETEIITWCKHNAEVLQKGLDELETICTEVDIELFPSLGKTSLENAVFSCPGLLEQFSQAMLQAGIWRHSRRSYFGGRNEVYRTSGVVDYVDRNSSYPAEYLQNYPVGKLNYLDSQSEVEAAFMNGSLGMYQVRVNIRPGLIAPLPVRNGIHLYFPVGTWEGIYNTADLETALSVDADIQFRQAWIWSDKKPILQPFLEKYAHLKNYGIFGKWSKLFLNSLSGKLGQSNETEIVTVSPKGEYLRGWMPKDIDKRIWTRNIYHIPKRASPIIAGYITAYARQELHRLMNDSDGLTYVDTDSIMAKKISSQIMISERIGDWKYEGHNVKVKIHAPKHYDIITENRTIKKGNQSNLTEPEKGITKKWIGNRILLPDGNTRTPEIGEIYHDRTSP